MLVVWSLTKDTAQHAQGGGILAMGEMVGHFVVRKERDVLDYQKYSLIQRGSPPKSSTNFQNSTTIWGPSIQCRSLLGPFTLRLQQMLPSMFALASRPLPILMGWIDLLSLMTGGKNKNKKRNVHVLVLEDQWMTMMYQLLPCSQGRLLVKISLTNWREPRSI